MESDPTEPAGDALAESNLLSSNLGESVIGEQRPTNSIDDIPIGGGSKFKWSEFPDDGAPPVKPPARKPMPKKKK